MPRIYQHKSTNYQPFSVPLNPGIYLLECWGAQGGTGRSNSQLYYHGGRGAYASGILDLKARTTFHLYIGTKGEDGKNSLNSIAYGGWNGGGNSGRDIGPSNDESDASGAGGGATDIRLVIAPQNEEATHEESLDSRIIVAAGGSGSVGWSYGAPGGDLTGYKVAAPSESYIRSDTTQTTGNRKGQGANGQDHIYVPSSGAGGGYYGGKASNAVASGDNTYLATSSSGSSYVSGFPGCETLTISRASVFNYKLLSPHIVNGFSNFPSVDYETTKTYEKGHEGNGAIKITLLQVFTDIVYHKSNILLYVAIFVINTK